MFRYKIALPISFTGQSPTIDHDDVNDMPLHTQVMITLGHDVQIKIGGGQLNLPTGSQISGIIIGKQQLPQGVNANP